MVVASLAGLAQCNSLKSLSLPGTTITSAELVPAGPYTVPTLAPGAQEGNARGAAPPNSPAVQAGRAVALPLMLPAHCRVTAVLTPSADSHIEIELWLPDNWN